MEEISPVMLRVADRLADTPVLVFSRLGEVLLQTRPAVVLFGDATPSGGGPARCVVDRRFTDPAYRERILVRCRHPWLGELELLGRRLIDPVRGQTLLILTAAPGSPSAGKLRRLVAADE